MGEWAVIIIMACVTLNGESTNQEVGLAINHQSELVIVIPSVLDVRLKQQEQREDFTLFKDEQGNLYSLLTVYNHDKFVMFLTQVEEVEAKNRIEHYGGHRIKFKSYAPLRNFVIASMIPEVSEQQQEIMDAFHGVGGPVRDELFISNK